MQIPFSDLINRAYKSLPNELNPLFIKQVEHVVKAETQSQEDIQQDTAFVLSAIAYKSKYQDKTRAGIRLMSLAQEQGYDQACISRAQANLTNLLKGSTSTKANDKTRFFDENIGIYFGSGDLKEFLKAMTEGVYSPYELEEVMRELIHKGDLSATFASAEKLSTKHFTEDQLVKSIAKRALQDGHVDTLIDLVKEEQADGFANRNYESLFKACDDIFTIKINANKDGIAKGSDNLGDVVRLLEFLIQRFDKPSQANKVILARPIRGLGKYAQIMPFRELKEAGLRLITMYKARLGNDAALNTIASDLAREDIDGTDDRVLAGFGRVTDIAKAIDKQPKRARG